MGQGQGGMMGQRGMMGHMMGMMNLDMMCGGAMGGTLCDMMDSGQMGSPTLYLAYRDKPELSEKQVAELKEIRLDFTRNTVQNRNSVQIAALELQDMLDVEQLDTGDIEGKIKEIHDQQAEIQVAAIRASIAAKAVLTPAQLDTFRNLLDQQGMMHGEQEGMEGMGMPGTGQRRGMMMR